MFVVEVGSCSILESPPRLDVTLPMGLGGNDDETCQLSVRLAGSKNPERPVDAVFQNQEVMSETCALFAVTFEPERDVLTCSDAFCAMLPRPLTMCMVSWQLPKMKLFSMANCSFSHAAMKELGIKAVSSLCKRKRPSINNSKLSRDTV